MPRLLLAPAGHSKTERVIQRIRSVLTEEPLAPVLVIIPNSIQANNFRKRLSASGGALGVEVHTFHTLYAELLTRAGQPLPFCSTPSASASCASSWTNSASAADSPLP